MQYHKVSQFFHPLTYTFSWLDVTSNWYFKFLNYSWDSSLWSIQFRKHWVCVVQNIRLDNLNVPSGPERDESTDWWFLWISAYFISKQLLTTFLILKALRTHFSHSGGMCQWWICWEVRQLELFLLPAACFCLPAHADPLFATEQTGNRDKATVWPMDPCLLTLPSPHGLKSSVWGLCHKHTSMLPCR